LHVSVTDPYLRASPDAIVSCKCHRSNWLLEVKCPWTVRNVDPADAADSGVFEYVRKVNGTYKLVPCAATGYYEQVHGTMAVCGLAHCDFVIWTMRGMLVIPVEFDTDFWASARCQLQQFFEKVIVAEILTERVWRALPLFEDDDSAWCAVTSASCVADDPCVIGMQEFDDDIVLDDDKVEDSFLEGLQLQSTGSEFIDTGSCDNFEMCDVEPIFFDISDFVDEATVDLN